MDISQACSSTEIANVELKDKGQNVAISLNDRKKENVIFSSKNRDNSTTIKFSKLPYSEVMHQDGLTDGVIDSGNKSLSNDEGKETDPVESNSSNFLDKCDTTSEQEIPSEKYSEFSNVVVGSINPRVANNAEKPHPVDSGIKFGPDTYDEGVPVIEAGNLNHKKCDKDNAIEIFDSLEENLGYGGGGELEKEKFENVNSVVKSDSGEHQHESKIMKKHDDEKINTRTFKLMDDHCLKNFKTNVSSGLNENEYSIDDALQDKDIEISKNEDDLVSTKAAMAMAAVAAAASANNTSPSAAAEAARLLAPDLVPEAISSQNEELKTVTLSVVKAQLLKRTNSAIKYCSDSDEENNESPRNKVQQRLALGENDAYLQYLLLLQYFRVEDEADVEMTKGEQKETSEIIAIVTEPMKQSKASASCEKVRSLLRMVEDAYDAMKSLLPRSPNDQKIDLADTGPEFLKSAVPDLLPPCISIHGDATHQFFRACLGEHCEIDTKNSLLSQIAAPVSFQKSDSVPNEAPSASVALHATSAPKAEPQKTAASVFSSMFSSMTRSGRTPTSRPSTTLASVFRKRNKSNDPPENSGDLKESNTAQQLSQGEYSVSIDREMLGLTVENVLERTVVRTVLPGGAAKKAGAKIGSLIVKVGNKETKNLTHFETIDELRQSQRPLKLVLRQITSDALRSAREEMGRLIRGGGFGTFIPIDQNEGKDFDNTTPRFRRTHYGKPPNVEAFSQVLHKRWNKSMALNANRKHEALVNAGEKLVWILTLLVLGLEREASKKAITQNAEISFNASTGRLSQSFHEAESYAEASKSISKVLHDFVSLKLLNSRNSENGFENSNIDGSSGINMPSRVRRNIPVSIPIVSRLEEKKKMSNITNMNTSFLLRIGDVLHRTTTFLADPKSPPAALLRGEVISFLCDVLDIDTEMELAAKEEGSSTSGSKLAPVNDLGSAGSLLKLIILNCLMSPGCQSSGKMINASDSNIEQDQVRRFGSEEGIGVNIHCFNAGNRFLAVVHRLAASRSTSARVAACSLGPVLWGHLDFPHQLQLRGVITRALHDVDIVVRKSTAAVLHAIAELVFDPRAVQWLVLMCERAMTDPEPQLRAAAMTLTYHLCEHLPNAFLGDASEGSRSLRRLPQRSDPTFQQVYLLQCKLLPVATRLAEDRAPSVRLAVAAQCDKLCSALGEHWYSVIIDVLQALLIDSEETVRGEAILCVPRLAEIVLVSSFSGRVGVAVLEALLPVSVKLLNDPSPKVRVALAASAGDLLTLLVGLESIHEISPRLANHQSSEKIENSITNKAHVDETLIPLLQKLLHDNEPEVTSAALRAVTNASRGNVREIRARQNSRIIEDDSLSLSSYHSHASLEKVEPVFIPVLSEEQVMRLIPTLSELANSRQWRMRQGAVEIVPALLGCTTKLEIRSEVAGLCFRLMDDHVDAVRRTAAECLCLSGCGFGSNMEESSNEWIETIVIPHVKKCSLSKYSKQRILSLKMIEVILLNGLCSISKKTPLQQTQQSGETHLELFYIARSLASDSVPNVRLNVGKLICSIVSVLEDEEVSIWTQVVQEQVEAEESHENGGDRDVLYFAKRALFRIKEKDDISLPSMYAGS